MLTKGSESHNRHRSPAHMEDASEIAEPPVTGTVVLAALLVALSFLCFYLRQSTEPQQEVGQIAAQDVFPNISFRGGMERE